MPPAAPQHPSDADLAAFALGKLAPAAAGAVEHHLADCPACRAVAEHTPADSLVGLLRQANPAGQSASRALTPSLQGTVTKGSLPLPAPAVKAEDLPPALRDHPKYRVIRQLGQGGMGVVYQVEHKLMERLEAVKVISHTLVDQPEAVERFNREVRAAARLDHPHIVKAYDAEQAGELQLLAMEYVEGKSLADVLAKKGPLPIAHACHYARQAALGLQHAHERGMVHRDLKPQNLMLTPKGVVKILDFGLAKLASERTRTGNLTLDNVVMGTPAYLAPEQAKDTKTADIRADIYSLGCTLFCLLTARPPFADGEAMQVVLAHVQQAPPPLESLRPDAPPELAALVARMLAKDPAERPQTPKEVAEALAPFAKAGAKTVTAPAAETAVPPATLADGGEPFAGLAAPAVTRTVLSTRPADRLRWWIPSAAGVAALALGLGLWAGGVFTGRVQAPHGREPREVPVRPEHEADPLPPTTDLVQGPPRPEPAAPEPKASGSERPKPPEPGRPGPENDRRTKWVHSQGFFEYRQNGLWYELDQYHRREFSFYEVSRTPEAIVLRREAEKGAVLVRLMDTRCEMDVWGSGYRNLYAGSWEFAQPQPTEPTPPAEGPSPKPPAPKPAPATPGGFVSLFNGRDLTGWKEHPDSPGDWQVKDGILVGRIGQVHTYLFSERGDYENVHLRAEARTDSRTDGGLFVRSHFVPGWPAGYEAQINNYEEYPRKTGSLIVEFDLPAVAIRDLLVRPNQWFTEEFIANGNHLTVKVNGRVVASYTDPLRRYTRGHLALQAAFPEGKVVEFRKIEVKELPPSGRGAR
jgi:tRNA A-37 threonylcarbamoyl transferase component Bud32